MARRGRIPFVVLSIFLVLLLNLLAAAPSLHELLHPDAGKSGHQCAVALFAHGQVDSPTTDVAAVMPISSVESRSVSYVSIDSTSLDTLPPGRAPPVSLLHS